MEHVLQQERAACRQRQVFVITDGAVSNSEECAKLVRRHNNNNRVFTLGLGAAADRHLVKGLARAGWGTAAFTSNNENISAKVMIMVKALMMMMRRSLPR